MQENPCEHPVVILKDVLPEDVEALLSFVYQGVVYVSEKKLSSFLQTAELLQIKGLAGAASSFDAATSKLNSSSDNAGKRRKGAPVRIMKHEDGSEETSGGQMETEEEGGNDDMDDSKNVSITLNQFKNILLYMKSCLPNGIPKLAYS